MTDVIKKIETLYGITVSQTPERVTRGVLSENYFLISDQGRFFLKKYRFDSEQRIKEIHAAKQFFSGKSIPVILPIVSNDQKTYFSLDAEYYALFPFIKGKEFERGALTEKAIVSMGHMLANIHRAGSAATLPITEDVFKTWKKEDSLNKIKLILENMPKEQERDAFDTSAYTHIHYKKELIEKNTLEYEHFGLDSDHLLHGDYLDHNIFFDGEDSVEHVFDFEKSHYGPRTYEIFRSLMYSLLSNGIDESDIQRAKLYLDSYREIYPIEKEELIRGLHVYYLKSIHTFWVEYEHYMKGNNRPDQFLESDIARTTFLSHNLEKLIDIF